MEELIVHEARWKRLMSHFAATRFERMAFAYCGENAAGGRLQHLMRELDLCDDSDYRQQSGAFVSLPARSTVTRILRAREHATFVDMHSHPFAEMPWPSGTDEEGARQQIRCLRDLAPETRLLRMIVAGSGRVWAATTATNNLAWRPLRSIRVLGAGGWRFVTPVNVSDTGAAAFEERDARTREVVGDSGTALLRGLDILVIGCGGTGSGVARLLAGYVGGITLCDPDRIEAHNSPRLHFFAAGDEGRFKADVAAREIARAFPDCAVQAITDSFPSPRSMAALKRADFVFCCPDHPAPRFAAARESARYAVPLIEVGCGGRREDGVISALGYHVRLQLPGYPCLACNGLDLSQLEEQSSTEMKRHIGYLNDGSTVAGELMPLTTRAAADAVEVFLRYSTGYAAPVPYNLYYDALNLKSIDVSASYSSRLGCTLCGEGAMMASAGDRLCAHQMVLELDGGRYATV